MYVCMYVCMYIHTYVCSTYVRTYVCMYVYMYVCMYVRTNVCTVVCVLVHVQIRSYWCYDFVDLLPQAEHLPFIHADSDGTDEYSFDTAFLQFAECLETYVYKHIRMIPVIM